ncbi:DUF3567 domain-containing protein, partial [Burkholderia pseudomallei]|nr:DUF3567 domain-containing protein [Burkholderia pseudomallei]
MQMIYNSPTISSAEFPPHTAHPPMNPVGYETAAKKAHPEYFFQGKPAPLFPY